MASTISDHTIIKRLGEGGMGQVFLAQDLKLRRKVALKVLSDKYLENQELRARFLREARNAAALSHPNICTVFQVGEVEEEVSVPGPSGKLLAGTPFLSMEFLEGKSLDEVINRESPLSNKRILGMLTQIADGLAEAHKRGIVHRDLKPQNIMETTDGRIKILDFGLAKEVKAVDWGEETTPLQTAPAQLTGEGTILGTPAYMSPEQAMGHEVDVRSDIFSFGLILHELVTGHTAFHGKSPMSLIAKVIESEPAPMQELRTGFPPGLASIRDRCLKKKPDERFQDGSELHAALMHLGTDAAPTGMETVALDVHPPRPRFLSRTWITAALAVVTVGLLGALVKELVTSRTPGPGVGGPTLAVLPFDHVGPTDRDYLAQGLTQEVTTRLSSLRDLNVISSTSAKQYRGSEKSAPEIGEELGAQFLLSGSVHSMDLVEGVPDTVRITVLLVDVGEDTNVMNRTFLEPATRLFDLQANVANVVARELDLELLGPARAEAGPPTGNTEAYQAYLNGIGSGQDYTEEASLKEIANLERAVQLDAGFALAHAYLSMAHSRMFWFGFDYAEERLSLALAAAEKALALDKDLPEAHLAMGYYHYRAEQDYPLALEKFNQVLVSMPNNSDLLFALAAVQRRDRNFEGAAVNFERAARLDPRSHVKVWEAGETRRFVREFRTAEIHFERALALNPAFSFAYVSLAELYLLGKGNADQARRVLGRARQNSVSAGDLDWVSITCSVFDQDYDQALMDLEASQFDHPATALVFELWVLDLQGLTEQRTRVAESLRVMLESVVAEDPQNPSAYSFLGLAHAGLGNTEAAVEAADRAVEIAGELQDPILVSEMQFQSAWVHTMLGEASPAIEHLKTLISSPSWITAVRLGIDPTFSRLEEEPAFKTLVDRSPST